MGEEHLTYYMFIFFMTFSLSFIVSTDSMNNVSLYLSSTLVIRYIGTVSLIIFVLVNKF